MDKVMDKIEQKLEPKDYMAIGKVMDKFHTHWLENGQPHPGSNEYLALNRSFFYLEGIKAGYKIAGRKK